MPRPVKIALIVLVVLVGLYVAASLALPGLNSARVSGNEASAIGSVRSVQSAQLTFAATECQGMYAPRLTVLGTSGYISPDLGTADTVEKAGYRISLRTPGAASTPANLPPACAGSVASFVVTAEPLVPGETGIRYFRGTEQGEVEEATASDFSDAKPVR